MNQHPTMTQRADGCKEWRLHNELHRDDGPAIEWADGTKAWYLHGKLHRENAPAIEHADGATAWYLHGELHCVDGAAVEYPGGYKQWFLHGRQFNDAEAWAERVLQMQNKLCDAMAVDAFLKQMLKQNIEHAL